jgi:hypothetical protein
MQQYYQESLATTREMTRYDEMGTYIGNTLIEDLDILRPAG